MKTFTQFITELKLPKQKEHKHARSAQKVLDKNYKKEK